jgi:hypothetical protein
VRNAGKAGKARKGIGGIVRKRSKVRGPRSDVREQKGTRKKTEDRVSLLENWKIRE